MQRATRLSPEAKSLIDRIIRVDHAGELGANRIYQGQLAVLGKTAIGPQIEELREQEKVHLEKFEALIPVYRARPTVLLPFWNMAGYALGVGSALLGTKAAMACTVAVESVITDHYNNQIRQLMEQDSEKYKELLEILVKCRDDEIEHHDIGLQHDAEQAPFYNLFSKIIKAGCHASIYLAERI